MSEENRHRVTAVIAALAAFAAMSIADPGELASCQFEDGNPDGNPCLWVDHDTGRSYVSLSEGYR